MMIRWICGVTLNDRCKSEELRKPLEIEDVADVWDSLVTWRERMWETGYQHAEI